MKKLLSIAICMLIAAGMFVGCSKSSKSSEKADSDKTITDVTKPTKAKTLTGVSNDATELWNEVICEVSHYSTAGKSASGKTLDIDFVISNMDKYLDKVKEDKEYIDSLGDEYNDIKNAFDKMLDKAIIICNHLKEETPKPNTPLSYKDDIDLFKQYFDYFYKAAIESNQT